MEKICKNHLLVKSLLNRGLDFARCAEKPIKIFLMSIGGEERVKMEVDMKPITVYVFAVNVIAYSMLKKLL
jgi:hypothetical protein